MCVFTENVWGDNEYHMMHIKIKDKLGKLFKELWEDEETPKECKLDFSYYTWRAWGDPTTSNGIQIIRLPWFNIAIISTGDIISLNQLDDILEAIEASNKELEEERDKIRKEFEENPTTNDGEYGPVLKYNTDKSYVGNGEFITMAKPKDPTKECGK